uniref:RRM domain-containing protein n=1 Tax=Oryza meridionalis TaxID=40149 RepID=A0A0E0CHG9_9ORYZ
MSAAVNEETSVYVGGLPYEANEDMLRDAFGRFGTIVSVKVINDQRVRGKCYGFVTFTHADAAQHAISGMDGKRINRRVVRVNEVRTRGAREFGREGFRREPGSARDAYWDRRDRERSYDRDRDPYHDRDSDRSRDRDRDRFYEPRGFDQEIDYPMDQDHGDERCRDYDRAAEMHNVDSDNDREKENSKDYDSEREKEKEQRSRKRFSRPKDHDSRDLSVSSDDLHSDAKRQLNKAIQMREDLENEVSQIKDKVAAKEQHIADLQKRSQKLEDELSAARKVSSERQLVVTKLYKCFLQLQDYNDRVKMSEKELQSLIDDAMGEVDIGEDATTKDGSMYENGVA